ncbi:MAG TPA: CBS domain-containing protein [Gammaproteobacteria bacterium]|nr:CBS domain-containing protein [Gammaproteobacteria bacterium]
MSHSMCVRDDMTTTLFTLQHSQEVLRAVRILVENDISGAPVVDESGKLVGILTERDCMRIDLEAGYYEDYGGRVENYRRKNVISIDPDMSILELTKCIDAPYRRYPVVKNDRLIGLISRRDVMHVLDELW